MNLELVSVITTDKLQLPGLLYTPEKATNKVAVWLHGMGDSGAFYNPDRINALGSVFTDNSMAVLAFNNRGAHNRKTLRIMDETLPEDDQGYTAGTHFERIADCVADIDGAVSFLKAKGFKEFYLLGHSTGANKVCAYHVRVKQNPFSKYVLAGPGDDSGLYFDELGKKKFHHALDYANRNIAEGKPFQIMPKYSGMYPFSAQAAADIMNPDGDYNTFPFYEYTTKRLGKKPLFAEYKQIDRPTLVIFGVQDEFAYTAGNTKDALDIFRKMTNKSVLAKSAFQLVPNADHSFHGAEVVFAETVSKWLASDG